MPAKRTSRKRTAAVAPPKATSGEITIALRWAPNESLPTLYANQLFISHAGGEFYLVFGEVVPPAGLVDASSVPEYLEVKPVARLAISPTTMIRMAEVISQNVARLKLRLEQVDEGTQEKGS